VVWQCETKFLTSYTILFIDIFTPVFFAVLQIAPPTLFSRAFKATETYNHSSKQVCESFLQCRSTFYQPVSLSIITSPANINSHKKLVSEIAVYQMQHFSLSSPMLRPIMDWKDNLEEHPFYIARQTIDYPMGLTPQDPVRDGPRKKARQAIQGNWEEGVITRLTFWPWLSGIT